MLICNISFFSFSLATEPTLQETTLPANNVDAEAVKESTEINQVDENITEMDENVDPTTLAVNTDIASATEVERVETANTTDEKVNEIDGEVTEKAAFTGKSAVLIINLTRQI